jgi:hypothetical protein
MTETTHHQAMPLIIGAFALGVASVAVAQSESATTTGNSDSTAVGRVKTSDKQQKAMLEFVKGREAPPSTEEPTGGKPTDGGVYEDPDAGGEVSPSLAKPTSVSEPTGERASSVYEDPDAGGEVSPALAKPTSVSEPTELKRASEVKLQVGQMVPQGLRNYVPYRRLPQSVQQQVKKGSRFLVLDGNILYEIDPDTDQVTNSYSTDYPLLRASLAPE